VVRFRFSKKFDGYLDEELLDDVIEQRRSEADEFYWRISPLPMADDLRNIQRQALSGMLWTKQVRKANSNLMNLFSNSLTALPLHLGPVGEWRSWAYAPSSWT
jgi:hypothetical protein